MRKLIGYLLPIILTVGCSGPAEEVMFFTEGNCKECSTHISSALEDLSGVESANWNFETSLTTVMYHPERISEDDLQQALAKAGFKTGYFEPDSAARAALPECCREPITRKLKPGQALPPGH